MENKEINIENKKKLLVFEIRPERIKMTLFVKEFVENTEELDARFCISVQRRQMLDQILFRKNTKPDYDFYFMKPNRSINSVTAEILMGTDYIKMETESLGLLNNRKRFNEISRADNLYDGGKASQKNN